MDPSRVTLYSFSFSHHGRYSSFHRLLHYARAFRTIDATPPLLGVLPPVWQRRLEYRWRLWSEWRLRPIFARKQRQCVHYLYPENSLFRGHWWKGRHALVLSCHQPATTLLRDIDQPSGTAFVQALKSAERVVLLSKHFASAYEKLCSPDSLRIIPHGVDTDFFKPANPRNPRPLVLTIGNWLRDYDFWADVAFAVSRYVPNVEFTVIALPEVVDSVRERAQAQLGSRVRFLNGVTDRELKVLYQQASALFLPLKDAGANNALLESMASGLPILVTDLPATREYGGECAQYFKPGDQEACLTHLQRLLNAPRVNDQLGLSGRQRALDFFSWKAIAARYAELYAEIL